MILIGKNALFNRPPRILQNSGRISFRFDLVAGVPYARACHLSAIAAQKNRENWILLGVGCIKRQKF